MVTPPQSPRSSGQPYSACSSNSGPFSWKQYNWLVPPSDDGPGTVRTAVDKMQMWGISNKNRTVAMGASINRHNGPGAAQTLDSTCSTWYGKEQRAAYPHARSRRTSSAGNQKTALTDTSICVASSYAATTPNVSFTLLGTPSTTQMGTRTSAYQSSS